MAHKNCPQKARAGRIGIEPNPTELIINTPRLRRVPDRPQAINQPAIRPQKNVQFAVGDNNSLDETSDEIAPTSGITGNDTTVSHSPTLDRSSNLGASSDVD